MVLYDWQGKICPPHEIHYSCYESSFISPYYTTPLTKRSTRNDPSPSVLSCSFDFTINLRSQHSACNLITLLMKIKQKLPYHWLASQECRSTDSWWWGSSFHTHSETLPTCTYSPSSWPHTGQKFCSHHKVHTYNNSMKKFKVWLLVYLI